MYFKGLILTSRACGGYEVKTTNVLDDMFVYVVFDPSYYVNTLHVVENKSYYRLSRCTL